MNNDNFVTVAGWMCNELNLKGNELLVFALIYGFSQDGKSEFRGSRNYIGSTFNISLPTVDKALKSLVEKELLIKRTESSMCVDFNYYRINLQVVKKLYRGSKETLHTHKETLQGGSKETLYNNYNNKNINNKDKEKKGKSKKEKFLDSISNKLQEYDFKQTVEEKILGFFEMWFDNGYKPPVQSIEAQLNLLATMGLNEQLNSIDTSIRQGWRSLAYENSNTSRRGFVDTAPQDLKWNKEQREIHKDQKGMSF